MARYYYWRNKFWKRNRYYYRRKRFWRTLKNVQKQYHKVNLKMDFLITPSAQDTGNSYYYFTPITDAETPSDIISTLTFNQILTMSQSFQLYKNLYNQMKITGCSVYVNCSLGTNGGAVNHIVRLYVSEFHASNLSSEAVANSTNAFILPSSQSRAVRRYYKYIDKDWIDTDKINELNGRIAIGCEPAIVTANIANYERYNMSVVLYCSFKNSILNKK